MELRGALQASLSAAHDARAAATARLEELECASGYARSLLDVVADTAAPAPLRLAAATALRRTLARGWADGSRPAEEERPAVREALLATLLGPAARDTRLRALLLECFRVVLSVDYPTAWPAVVPTLRGHLDASMGDPARLACVLGAVHVLCKKYQFHNATTANVRRSGGIHGLTRARRSPRPRTWRRR